MRYTWNYDPTKKESAKEMLVAALSAKTGKSENELRKLSKQKLREMWNKLPA